MRAPRTAARRGITQRWYGRLSCCPISKSDRRARRHRTRIRTYERVVRDRQQWRTAGALSMINPRFREIQMRTPRELLRRMFDAAINAAQPSLCLLPHLPPRPRGRMLVIGAGKASAAMARAVEDNVDGTLEGLVVTRYGYAVPCERIEIVEAAHPVPDAAGIEAARRIGEKVVGLTADD